MRPRLLLALLLCAIASVAHAQADAAGQTDHDGKHDRRPQVSSRQCGLGTDFNVLADSGGIWLYRDGGAPREIFFHGGALNVDKHVQQITAADAQRLWDMEREARALMPQVAGLAHEVADLSYDALGGVIEIMTGSWLNARKIERMRKRAKTYIDDTLGKGRWEQSAFGGNFERYVQDQAEDFKGSIARHLLFQIFTGRADNIEARGDRMGDALDARLDARSETIEAKAHALCIQVDKLRAQQDALEFRYQGQPLQMLAPLDERAPVATAAAREANDADTDAGKDGDTLRDGAIGVSPGNQD
jgi:hypothetical protein